MTDTPLADVAVIGGTGFYSFLTDATEHRVETPYGAPSGPISVGEVAGTVVFVRHSLPGERVVVTITEGEVGSRFLRGDAVEVLTASPDRVTPPCPLAGPGPDRCGGCDLQHVDLAALIGVLDFSDGKIPVLHPVLGPGGLRYPVPVEDFDLTRCQLDSHAGVLTTAGPQLILCTEGSAVLASADSELPLAKGQAAFVPAGAPVSARGPAVLYRATTNLR